MQCPCNNVSDYSSCCEPLHFGLKEAKTAKELMASRYSAYVQNELDYLLNTWHPSTRPKKLEKDETTLWRGLNIKHFGTHWVDFEAYYEKDGKLFIIAEKSEFYKDPKGHWLYLGAWKEAK